MPVTTRSKRSAKRGAPPPENEQAIRVEDSEPAVEPEPVVEPILPEPSFILTAADKCAARLAEHPSNVRDLTEPEQVIRNKLIRDLALTRCNPWKLSGLQSVLNLRNIYGVMSDIDLKECYFMKAWQFREDEFPLANWREMSVEEMKKAVKDAHPYFQQRRCRIYPPDKVDVDTLETKEEIVRAYSELTYVPEAVYKTAVGGAHVLRSLKAKKIESDYRSSDYLSWACRANLDTSVIREIADIVEGFAFDPDEPNNIKEWMSISVDFAVKGGNVEALEILDDRYMFDGLDGVDYRGRGPEYMTTAAGMGHDALIDYLAHGVDTQKGWGRPVTENVRGVDPSHLDETDGWNALHAAAYHGRIRTVKHLVEKYDFIDIHEEDESGNTALDSAEENGRTECAAFLRELMSTRRECLDETGQKRLREF